MGELILGERYLTVTFRFRADEGEAEGKIAWDCNEKSLDGFSPETGWIRIDLTKLFHIHRVYETKRERLQRKASKKPSLRKVLAKYSNRERNRAEDYIHKLALWPNSWGSIFPSPAGAQFSTLLRRSIACCI
jgi:putative transposase